MRRISGDLEAALAKAKESEAREKKAADSLASAVKAAGEGSKGLDDAQRRVGELQKERDEAAAGLDAAKKEAEKVRGEVRPIGHERSRDLSSK